MRPPISSTKNDGVHSTPLHRKTQTNQKEILLENQNIKNRSTQNTANSFLKTTEITPTTTLVINQQPTTIQNNIFLCNTIVNDTLDTRNLLSHNNTVTQLDEDHRLYCQFNEKPSTSSSVDSNYSNDTTEFNLNTKIPSQLISTKLTQITNSSNLLKQQSNQQEQQHHQQQRQQQQQSQKNSINHRKLKRLSSDVSDNRLKYKNLNPLNTINKTIVSNQLVKINSNNVDSSSSNIDRYYLNINNKNINSKNNLVNNTNNENLIINVPVNSKNDSRFINDNNITERNNDNKSKSIISNFEYAADDNQVQQNFYYQNEKNYSLSPNNLIINQQQIDTEPLLKSIENINVISETNRNSFNKNSASSILINNKELNNDKINDSKVNNNNDNNINNKIKTTNINTDDCHLKGTTNNCKNFNITNTYNNCYDSIILKQDNFDKNKKRDSYQDNNHIQNFIPIIDSNDLSEKNQIINQLNTAAVSRKQLAYSWYGPIYSTLKEEIEQEQKDSTYRNLADLKKNTELKQKYDENSIQSIHDDNETQFLLENNKNQINIQPQIHQQISNQKTSRIFNNPIADKQQDQTFQSSKLNPNDSINSIQNEKSRPDNPQSNNQQSLISSVNQIPKKKCFKNFIKTLVSRKSSKELSNNVMPSQNQNYQQQQQQQLQASSTVSTSPDGSYSPQLLSPQITITHSSSQDFIKVSFSKNATTAAATVEENNSNYGASSLSNSGSEAQICDIEKITQSSNLSLNTVQQKIWNFVPLLRRESSAASLYNEKSQSIAQYTGLRKCETVLALSSKSSTVHMYNQRSSNCNVNNCHRENNKNVPGVVYNRCVSYNSSGMNIRYSKNRESIVDIDIVDPIRPLNRLRNSSSITNANCSRCSSLLSVTASGSRYSLNLTNNNNNNNNNINNNYKNNKSNSCTTVSSSNNSNSYNLNKSSNLINYDNYNKFNPYDNLSSGGNTTNNLYDAFSNLNSCSIEKNKSITSADSNCIDNIDGGLISDDIINNSPQSSKTDISTTATLHSTNNQQKKNFDLPFVCKLCLTNVNNSSDATLIMQCNCNFCTECMVAYVDFEISEGAYEISCPDAQCSSQGIMNLTEISNLASANALKNYHRYRLNREIELDKTRTWCPRAGCETICLIGPQPSSSSSAFTSISSPPKTTFNSAPNHPTKETTILSAVSSIAAAVVSDTFGSQIPLPSSSGLTDDKLNLILCAVHCPTCREEFCSGCKKSWHPNITCDENNRRLTETGQDDLIGIPFDNDLIKSCPMCAVPIEKDEGCAQMMCKRCKHVFCWYCLTSLDDDFLLRHYDKGPCKNKLGHSRASVVWHRAQVIGIFAGFGILLLVASPLLLLAAPCIICCKCRICSNGNTKLDDPNADFDDAIVLQR